MLSEQEIRAWAQGVKKTWEEKKMDGPMAVAVLMTISYILNMLPEKQKQFMECSAQGNNKKGQLLAAMMDHDDYDAMLDIFDTI